MAKNRIKNIDEIVTQAGTIVDLDNIQATGGGGSTATVNAGNLAISKTETSNEIGYHFNEGAANPHGADGHKDGVSTWMHLGMPNPSSGHNYKASRLYSFADPQTNDVAHIELGSQRNSGAAVSDATKVLQVGGSADWSNDIYVSVAEMVSFTAGSALVTAGSMGSVRIYPVGFGDGTDGWAGTGMSSGGSTTGAVDKWSMSDGSVALSDGTVTSTYVRTAQSNGTYGYFFGGMNTNIIDRMQLSDSSVSNSHGTLRGNRAQAGATSNADFALLIGGSPTWPNAIRTVEKFDFAADTTSTQYGTATLDTDSAFNCASGDGNEGWMWAGATVKRVSFADDSFAASFAGITSSNGSSGESGSGN